MNEQSEVPESEVSVLDVLQGIGSRWKSILAVTLGFAALGFLYAKSLPPVYNANALLQLEQKNGGLALNPSMAALIGGQNGSPAVAEIEIVKSRLVIDRAIAQLKLDILAVPKPAGPVVRLLQVFGISETPLFGLDERAWGGEAISVSDLRLPPEWARETLVLMRNDDSGFALRLPDGRVIQGRVGVGLVDAESGVRLLVEAIKGPVGRHFLLQNIGVEGASQIVRDGLAIQEAARQSNILRLDFRHTDPRLAERVLDGISRAYVEQNIERLSAETSKSLDFVNNRLPSAEKQLEEAQQALNRYMAENKAVDIRYETEAMLERAATIEVELGKLELQEAAIRERYTASHPEYQSLIRSRRTLELQLDTLKATASGLPETQKEVFNLMRQQEVAQSIYLQLQTRAQELQVLKASAIGSVRIVDAARAGPAAVSPRVQSLVLMSALMGLFLIGSIIAWRIFTRTDVKTTSDLERIGLPVFATVNHSVHAKNTRSSTGHLEILAETHPQDIVVEALRSLRTSLHFGMLDAKNNAVTFTSPAPGAGKSFTAVNLAAVAAQAGQRVCLIDADLRRGYLRRYFGVDRKKPGLAEVLAGNMPFDEVAVSTRFAGLTFVPTGAIPPNPSEMLLRPSMAALLDRLAAEYDLVILDAPPILAVTDPVILSRSSGTTILVVRHMKTPLGEVEAVMRAVQAAGCRINGAILNDFDIRALAAHEAKSTYSYRYSYQNEDKP